MKSSIPYDFLSMIAEMGGYVGLFLGISLQQLARIPYRIAKSTMEVKAYIDVEG